MIVLWIMCSRNLHAMLEKSERLIEKFKNQKGEYILEIYNILSNLEITLNLRSAIISQFGILKRSRWRSGLVSSVGLYQVPT